MDIVKSYLAELKGLWYYFNDMRIIDKRILRGFKDVTHCLN